MKGSDFVFDHIYLLYCKCHKINWNRGGSYTDSLDWIKNKKATINSINKKDNKCFQHAETAALNHEKIRKHPERITKIKPFINKYKWKETNFSWEKDDWKKFRKIMSQLLLMFYMLKKKKTYPTYVSKHNSNREKQLIFLMISNGGGRRWHYLAVKKLSALLRWIT